MFCGGCLSSSLPFQGTSMLCACLVQLAARLHLLSASEWCCTVTEHHCALLDPHTGR